MIVKSVCPTPKKGTYYDLTLAESVVIQLKYNRSVNAEVYQCVDHWHVRDKGKRRAKERARAAPRKAQRRQYRQLTIFDWMNELNGEKSI